MWNLWKKIEIIEFEIFIKTHFLHIIHIRSYTGHTIRVLLWNFAIIFFVSQFMDDQLLKLQIS